MMLTKMIKANDNNKAMKRKEQHIIRRLEVEVPGWAEDNCVVLRINTFKNKSIKKEHANK